MASWASLGLWHDEEKEIHKCLQAALKLLISKKVIASTDEENTVTEHLYKHIQKTSKKYVAGSGWTVHAQATSCGPLVHPDLRFSRRDKKQNQYDYDVECKLLRAKKLNPSTDYCYEYVVEGIKRYESGYYARNRPVMGTMLGYVQDGVVKDLINTVNDKVNYQGLNKLQMKGRIRKGSITTFDQEISRNTEIFTLFHFWADFR